MTSAPTLPRLPVDDDDGLPKEPVPVIDHRDEALGRLTTMFRDKPRLSALLGAFMAQVQEIENTLFDVSLKRALDNAEGAQLDAIGRIVNQPRSGNPDARYRRFIRARIIVNNNRGHADKLMQALQLLDDPRFITRVKLTEYYPASFFIELVTPLLLLDPQEIVDFLKTGKPAGVRMQFIYQQLDSSVRFTFGTGTSATQGWSSTRSPTGGGVLSGVREA